MGRRMGRCVVRIGPFANQVHAMSSAANAAVAKQKTTSVGVCPVGGDHP